jgi:capsular polysaccharide export protein
VRRRFLFLQGPCTPFFQRLADRLEREGHEAHRVNFCAGDAWYWGGRVAWHYDDADMRLVDFLDDKYRRLGITDQILFGDRRPVHRPAVEHAERYGIRTHVFEEGYFRPHWITLEREGVNGHSLLPRDPDWFRDTGQRLAEPPSAVAFHSPFRLRAFHDVVYHVAGALNSFLYPGYCTHAPVVAPVEYAAYLRRFAALRMARRREQQRLAELVASDRRYFLLPLQLNSDAQIRDHSRFEHMGEVIEYVMESFARHAPADAWLVVKNHPLDMGLMNYRRLIRDCGRRVGLEGRTLYLEQGDLNALVQRADGVVTVNSTVGMVALHLGRPTLTLGDPIYNLPGLTCQGKLDEFWTAAQPPDMAMFACFYRVVMHATQINGAFYCRQGIGLAVDNSARVLTAERSPLECLL